MNHVFENPEKGVEPVPGYCLAEKLGAGGFGEVWKAYAPGGFHVALKFVRLAQSCGAAERRALDIIRTLRHPNLLSTFASWEVNGWLVIGMELADMTLFDRYRQATADGGPGIPRDELLDYFHEAARGVDFLNEPRGPEKVAVHHRDIKPQNILLVGNGVKVADFGLAKLVHQSEAGHSGGMTPAYAAPEFFQGQTAKTSDQYSLAATYCKIGSGALPFEGTAHEILHGHLSKPPNLTKLPKAERPIVARALAKNPNDRWPTCRAFVEALIACQGVSQNAASLQPPTVDYDNRQSPKAAAETARPAVEKLSPRGGTQMWSGLPAGRTPGVARELPPAKPNAQGKPQVAVEGLRSWIIGRDAKCDLVVRESSVSSQHCRLTETADGFVIEDLKSVNGTFVNGQRVESVVPVKPKDDVTLGHSVPMPWPKMSHNATEGQVITIGRDATNDVVIDHASVSGRHARITIRQGEAHIEDLGSTNGLAVNGSKISAAPIAIGDTIYFGSHAVPASRLLEGGSTNIDSQRTIAYRGQDVVIGRDEDCDVVVDSSKVSGRHARLFHDGTTLAVEDLKSANGTLVNGKRVHRTTPVQPGDFIGIGGVSIRIVS